MYFDDYLTQLDKIDKASNKISNEMEKQMLKEYKASLNTIFNSLSEMYRRYEDNSGKLNYTDLQKVRQYEFLLGELNKEVQRITGFKLDVTNKGLSSIFEEEYLKGSGLLGTALENSLGLNYVNPVYVEEALNNNLSGLTLNERLTQQGGELFTAIKSELTQGLILGTTYKEMSKRIQAKLEGDATKATRIVRTESNRIRNEARQRLYKDASSKGVELVKMWNSRRDIRTRSNHRALDGVTVGIDDEFKINGYRALHPHGFGVASEDVNCRCRIIAVPEGHVLPERNKTWEQVDQEWKSRFLQKHNATEADIIEETVAKKAEPIKFSPAKTITEAEQFARNNLKLKVADFSSFDVNSANGINEAFSNMQTHFPEVEIDYISNDKNFRKDWASQSKALLPSDSGDALAYALMADVRKFGFNQRYVINFNIGVNSQKDKALIKNLVDTKYVNDSYEDIKAVFTHEFGHHVDRYLGEKGINLRDRMADKWINDSKNEAEKLLKGTNWDVEIKNTDFYKKLKSRLDNGEIDQDWFDVDLDTQLSNLKRNAENPKKIEEKAEELRINSLSKYATTKKEEFFAEAFSSYMLSSKPSKEVIEFGKELEKTFSELRGSKVQFRSDV